MAIERYTEILTLKEVNADLNGAANILRKAFLGIDLSLVDRALCANPARLYPLATVKKRTLKSKAAA
jgi:transposase